MIRVVKTLTIHIFCILIFTVFYSGCSKHFNGNNSMIDFLLFSTTVQAGVGITDILPISIYSKLLMITQQIIMISTHVITIYIFS